MSRSVPQPSLVALGVQVLLILAFGLCLFLFVRAACERNHYSEATVELNQQRQALQRAKQTLTSYRSFVAGHPFYQRGNGEIQWEKSDEVWVNLSYEELQTRLRGLYRDDRPFVLDYFSANIANGEGNPDSEDDRSLAAAQQTGQKGGKELVFHLQGYFLCPCN